MREKNGEDHNLIMIFFIAELHGGVVVSTLASQQMALVQIPGGISLCMWEFSPVPPRQFKNMLRGLMDDSK